MRYFLLIAVLVLITASSFVLSRELSLPKKEAVFESVTEKIATSSAPEPEIVQDLKKQINSLSSAVKDLKQIPPPKPSPTPEPAPVVKSADIYNKALGAVLNVFCYDRKAKGYILTNGHLAVRFEDPNTECQLRRGSPARNFAKAKVIWLPSQTPKIGASEIPKNDVAILKLTELADGSALSENFEYFEINASYVSKIGESLYSLNYPSEFLGADTALSNTNLVFTLGAVNSFLTVDDNTSDAEGVYLKGELSTQHGSSGGIFLDTRKGEIVG